MAYYYRLEYDESICSLVQMEALRLTHLLMGEKASWNRPNILGVEG